MLTIMTFVGKFFFMGFGYLFSLIKAEIFPTTLRQIGTGSCSVASRVGSTIAPYTRELVSFATLLGDHLCINYINCRLKALICR